MKLSAKAARSFIKDATGPFHGKTRQTKAEKQEKQQQAEGDGLPGAEWWAVGRWAARRVLADHYFYDRASRIWWGWKGGDHWEMIPTDSPELGDRLHEMQYLLSHELRMAGAVATAELVAKPKFEEEVKSVKSALMGGARAEMARGLALPPAHVVAVKNGVLDLLTGKLHSHDPTGPYLITAVTGGRYLPEELAELREVIDARLKPAITEKDRRKVLYKSLTLMLGGKGGGLDRGSILELLGHSGGGKGNTGRTIEDSFGTYAIVGNANSLFVKSEINEALAEILERNPRVILFYEVTRIIIAKILSMTGRDTLSARGPHKTIVRRRLNAGVVITAVNAPDARMDTGAKRRMAALYFPRRADVTRATETDTTTQRQADALVTVTLHDALTLWQKPLEWEGLAETDADTAAAVQASDAVEAAIDSLAGVEVNENGTIIDQRRHRAASDRDHPEVAG